MDLSSVVYLNAVLVYFIPQVVPKRIVISFKGCWQKSASYNITSQWEPLWKRIHDVKRCMFTRSSGVVNKHTSTVSTGLHALF